MNPSWPAWFVALVREYEFHYPPSSLFGDPVVCWHTIPPTGYVWRAGTQVILGSRVPLPEKPSPEESAASAQAEAQGEGQTAMGESEGDATEASESGAPKESAGEAREDAGGEGEAVERSVVVLYEYRLSDFAREQYRVEPLGGNMAHFERRPAASLVPDAKPSSRLVIPQQGIDIDFEDI